MNTQYRKNLKAVATACKNYTDTQIAQAKEEIYWHIGEYSVTTSDDNTSASVKTVPANATRCKIKRVYGNTQKLNPTTASDSTSAMIKTMPSTVYTFDVSKVEGASEVSENLLYSLGTTTTTQGLTFDVNNGNINVSGTPTSSYAGRYINSYLPNNSLAGTYTLANFTNDFPANCFLRLTFEKNGSRVYTFTLGASRQSSTYTFDGTETSFVLEYAFQNSTLTTQNGNIKPMLVKGSTALPYQPYFDGIHNFAWNGVKVEGANLFDKSTATEGKGINQNGNVINNQWTTASDYIEVLSNTNYILSGNQLTTSNNNYYAFYDGNKNFISAVQQATASPYIFTTPSNAKYLRFTCQISQIDNAQLNYGSVTKTYQPYISPTTIPIDLSTILYNGSPLFEGNSLKAVNDVKDILTPYKATKKLSYVDLGTLDWVYTSSRFRATITNYNYISASNTPNALMPMYTAYPYQTDLSLYNKSYTISSAGLIVLNDTSYTDAETFKTAMSGVYLVYELATPIEVSINWASTLRGITGYSNGTITLLNTYNMDSANTITYNSIIKENCCAKMVQSRNGSVIKTINFPTTASDGYSAGSVANVRDFTNNTRTPYVDRVDLGTLSWTYASGNRFYAELPSKKYGLTNISCSKYNTSSASSWVDLGNNEIIGHTSNNNVYIKDELYNDATLFKNSLSGVYLYYEKATSTSSSITAIENVIEVEAGDTLTFYDSNDNLVTIPTDLTYRIEVAN